MIQQRPASGSIRFRRRGATRCAAATCPTPRMPVINSTHFGFPPRPSCVRRRIRSPRADRHRRVLDGIFWIARTGAPWRDLPEELGNWNSVWRQFRRWSASELWDGEVRRRQQAVHAPVNQRLSQIMRDSGGVPSKPLRKAEPVAPFASFIGRDYAAAISRVALIGSFSTLQSALKFASRGLT